MRVWTASKDGQLSVSSFFSAIHICLAERIVMNNVWKFKAPPRVVIFGWMAIRKRILTLDNLRRRGRIVVNGCPRPHVFKREVSGPSHVILRSVGEWFDCCWVFPRTIPELFQAWRAPTGVPRGKELWRLTFLLVLWTIWKERNSRCFKGGEQ